MPKNDAIPQRYSAQRRPKPFLRGARAVRGLSQTALAEKAGIDRSTVSRIETGYEEPTWRMVQRLSGALELSAAVLLSTELPAEEDDVSP